MIISNQSNIGDFSQLLDIFLLFTALISTSISLLIPCLFYLRKECQSHPQVLIANISLLQSVGNFNIVLMAINVFTYQNFLNIKSIFHLLTFDLVHLTSTDQNTGFCVYNYQMFMLVQLLSISFHICYSVDLLITLKFPFFSGKKRIKFYYAFSVILTLLITAVSGEKAVQICQNELVTESICIVPFWFLVTLIIFCFISVIIVAISFFQQRSQAKIRRQYIKNHRIILSLLVLLWVVPIWTNMLIQMEQTNTVLFNILNKISFFCMVSSTGVICVARMTVDQYLRQRIKRMIFDLESRVLEQDMNSSSSSIIPIKNDSWNLPLSAAMREFHSQEIVHNIIQVVSEACTASKDTLYNSQLNQDQFNNQSVSSMSSHRTIVIQEQHESAGTFSGLFMRREEMRYQKLDPNQCTIQDLIRVCKKKRKFHMLCFPPLEEDRLGTKTVHMASNIVHQDSQVKIMLKINVTSYSHCIFETLRRYDNFTNDKITETLDISRNIQSIKQVKQSLGASGSFFFFSYDHRIVIKTISQQQKDRFLSLLPYYFDYIRYNQESLLARTYGIFAVQIQGVSKIYFIMMENTFGELSRAGVPYRVYDLKGSTVQREVTDPHAKVKKDINFLKSDDCFILLSPETKTRLIDQIEKDVTMLRRHNIMDYSLLLGVGKSQFSFRRRQLYARGVQTGLTGKGFRYMQQLEEVTRKVYSLSLIDYLQQFNFSKKMELWFKRIFNGGGDISSIGSELYFQRFMKFLNRIVLACEVKFKREVQTDRRISEHINKDK